MTVLELPSPPSTNAMYIVRGRHRVRSPTYRLWQEQAGWFLKEQKPKPVIGPVTIEIAIENNARRDIDNFGKPILDALVKFGIIEGDRFKTVKALTLRWSDHVRGVRVSIESLSTLERQEVA